MRSQSNCGFLTILLSLFIFHLTYAQQLSVEDELSFSTTAGNESGLRNLNIVNSGKENLIIKKLVLQGRNATQFNLRTSITFPAQIEHNKNLSLSFSFEPKNIQAPEIVKANLIIESNDSTQGKKSIDLYGLVAKGLEGENEPPLSMIVQALGYNIDVEGNQLQLDTSNILSGAEVKASLFGKAEANQPVMMIPVARYSPKEAVPFGYYFRNKKDQLRYQKVGTLSDVSGEHQTLYPRLLSGKISFDPKDTEFGLFSSTSSQVIYTESGLNTVLEHAVRIFRLRNKAGAKVPNSYLVCFEEAIDGDYQDFVFVLQNVKIVR